MMAWSTHAVAADPAPSSPSAPRMTNEGRADVLFHSGERKFDSGDFQGACMDFSESLKLGPKLGTLLNLALCHETTGRIVTAWHEFQHAAAWAAQNKQPDRQDFAREHIRALEVRLPRVLLQLPADRAISGIDLDGEPVPEQQWYLPLYLDPGEHMLGVSAPGKRRSSVAFRVILAPTDQIVVVPSLTDAEPDPDQPPPDKTKPVLALASLGIGALGIVTGATFGVLAITRDDGDPAIKDDATIATIAFVSGVAFAAAGGVLLWTSHTKGGGLAPAKVRAFLAPRPNGVTLGGSF